MTVGRGIVNKSQIMYEDSRMKVEQPESESGMVSGILPKGYVVPPTTMSGGRVKLNEVVEELDELDELEEAELRGSVVPDIVVTEPSGSVDIDGGMVVSD